MSSHILNIVGSKQHELQQHTAYQLTIKRNEHADVSD